MIAWLFALPIGLALLFGLVECMVLSSVSYDPYRVLLPPPQDSVASDHPLLNRPLNPALDIVYSKSGKPPQSITSDVVVGASIGRYYPDTDTWEPAPYVKQEPLHDLPMEYEMMEGI